MRDLHLRSHEVGRAVLIDMGVVMKHWSLGLVLSLASGAAIWYVIELVTGTTSNPEGPPLPYLLLNYALIIATPAVFGFYLPSKPWQWGIYVVFRQLVFGVATSVGDLNLLPLGILFYAVLAIPAMLFGFVGGFISNRLRRKSDS